MPDSVAGFKIFEIEKVADDDGLTVAKVHFSFEETHPSGSIGHSVTVKVRVFVPDDASIAELHEAVFRKAVDQLRHALEASEHKPWQALYAEEKARGQERKRDLARYSEGLQP